MKYLISLIIMFIPLCSHGRSEKEFFQDFHEKLYGNLKVKMIFLRKNGSVSFSGVYISNFRGIPCFLSDIRKALSSLDGEYRFESKTLSEEFNKKNPLINKIARNLYTRGSIFSKEDNDWLREIGDLSSLGFDFNIKQHKKDSQQHKKDSQQHKKDSLIKEDR